MGKTLPWKTKLAALAKFKQREGHTLVRQSYIDPDSGFRLGRWVANLRQRADFLTDAQLDDLERLDFVWSRFKVLPWEMKIDILRKYRNQHGHTLVPKDYVDRETDFHLGWWVDRMRQGKNTMNQNRIKDLEDLGFVWNAFDATWDTMFRLLQEYKAEHHHACPKINEHYKGKPLGHWVGMQRQLYSRKSRSGDEGQQTCNATTVISDKRVEQLNQIGFVWRLRTSGAADYDDSYTTVTDGSSNSQISNGNPVMTTLASYAASAASGSMQAVTPSPLATPLPASSSANLGLQHAPQHQFNTQQQQQQQQQQKQPATMDPLRSFATASSTSASNSFQPPPSSLTSLPGITDARFPQQQTSGGGMTNFSFMQGAAAAAAAAHLQFPPFRLETASQQLAASAPSSAVPTSTQSFFTGPMAAAPANVTAGGQLQGVSHNTPPLLPASHQHSSKIPAVEKQLFPNNLGTVEHQPSKESPITDETLLSSLAFLASSSGGNSPETNLGDLDQQHSQQQQQQQQQLQQSMMHHPQHIHQHMPTVNGNNGSGTSGTGAGIDPTSGQWAMF